MKLLVSFFKNKVSKTLLLLLILVSTSSIKAQWTQIGADIDGEATTDYSGLTVSMPDTNTFAVGAYQNDGNGVNAGHVRIFRRIGATWIQKGLDIDGEAANDRSGISVSMADSNTVAIGAAFNDGSALDAGHVRVYEWTGAAWVQKGLDIDGESAGDRSGSSVSMPDANTVAIGAFLNDGNGLDAGHVRIYEWTGVAWVQKGIDIEGEAANDQSGFSVSMPDANTVAIGANHNDDAGIDAGHVRIYEWSGFAWVQKGTDIDGVATLDNFGTSVSMPNATTVGIGAPTNDGNGLDAGHVRIYEWTGVNWVQKGLDIDGESAGDESGTSVSMPTANVVAIGAPNNDGVGTNAGHTRVYEWSGTAWQQLGLDINGELTDDRSGFSVSMGDSSKLAIGAYLNNGNGPDAGHVRVYDFIPCSMSVSININNNVNCFGANDGSLTANPTGGSAPFNYIWTNATTSPTANSLPAGAYSVTVTDVNGCVDSASSFITSPISLVVTSASIDVVCNGGSNGQAAAVAIGGTPPYTYLWSNASTTTNIIGLSAGIYTVTVTDNNGCTLVSSETVNEPPLLVASISATTNVSCNGGADGTATSTATGGIAPYTYSWSNAATTASISGLSSGTYTVTVTDDNNCTTTTSTTITEPTLLSSSISVTTNVSCNGGSDGTATVSPSGGTTPYTYLWSNAATTATSSSLNAATYTVTVSDANGCSTTTSTAILEPSLLNVNITVDSLPSSFGASDGGITANASGGTPLYTYTWSNAATTPSLSGLSSGTYTVTVTDNNNCSAVDFFVLSQPALLICTTTSTNTLCAGSIDGSATVNASGGVIPYTYMWNNSDITQTTNNLAAGTYTITVTDNNGITTTCTATIGSPLAITANATLSDESCNGLGDGAISTSTSGGTSPYTYNWNTSAFTSSISNLAAGNYTVTITDANGCTLVETNTIVVGDNIPPTAIPQNVTAYLDFNGQAIVSANDIDNGSFDNCTIASITINSSNFDCTNLGLNTIELLVIDNNSNRDSTSAIVQILDTIRPVALASNPIVYLGTNGTATISATSVDNGSLDNCTISSFSLSGGTYDCSDVGVNITEIFTVVDNSGNRDSIAINITVLDTINPTVIGQNINVFLDANRQAIITTADIDNGSIDSCGIANVTISKSSFNCAEVGANNVTLFATDIHGNTDSTSVLVTVIDTIGGTDDSLITSACENYTWMQNNVSYSTSGLYRDTAFNVLGCDSVYYILDLTINNAVNTIDTLTACDSLVWIDGVTYFTNNTTAVDTLINSNGCDSIITLNLTIVNSNGSLQTATSCDSYLWPQTNQSYTNSGFYTDILTNAAGCDSIIVLDLTILNLDVTIFNVGDSLFAFQEGNSYQWIDCAVDTIIPGATSKGYKPDTTGFYAVIVDNGFCSDTSSCQFIDFVSVKEIANKKDFKLYPNPANAKFYIETNALVGEDILQVYDMRGSIILERNIFDLKETVDVETWDAGIYFVRFQNQIKKIVITE